MRFSWEDMASSTFLTAWLIDATIFKLPTNCESVSEEIF